MLIFFLESKRKHSRLGVPGNPGDSVESLPVGASVVVDQSLRKVISVGERPAGNLDGSLVDGIQIRTEICGSLQAPRLFGEFAAQGGDQLHGFALRVSVGSGRIPGAVACLVVQALAGFIEDAGALHPGPWPDAKIGAVDVTHSGEAL